VTELVMSAQNSHLKLVRKLDRRRTREQEGLFVVEGEDLVVAGLEMGATARVLLVDVEREPDLPAALVNCPLVQVESKLLAGVSELGHPPRVIGIFELPKGDDLAESIESRSRRPLAGPWIALDGLGDPGNVGTVLRTIAALGGGGAVTLPGTSDPWGGKATRASMGACFRVPITRMDRSEDTLEEALVSVRELVPELRVVVLDATAEKRLWDVPLDANTLIVVGGERDGISNNSYIAADVVASIPQDPDVESVNAGVAASLALYEWRRQVGTSS